MTFMVLDWHPRFQCKFLPMEGKQLCVHVCACAHAHVFACAYWHVVDEAPGYMWWNWVGNGFSWYQDIWTLDPTLSYQQPCHLEQTPFHLCSSVSWAVVAFPDLIQPWLVTVAFWVKTLSPWLNCFWVLPWGWQAGDREKGGLLWPCTLARRLPSSCQYLLGEI